MPDQAAHLRQLVRQAVAQHGALAPGSPLIAVSGGRQGVGATTIVCGLARELARLGKRVALVDANLLRPALAEHFGVPTNGAIADVLAGRRCAVESLVTAEGISILTAGSERLLAQLDRRALATLLAELSALSRQCDVVLLDAGAGMTPWTHRLWQACQQVLLASTAEDGALVESYAVLKQAAPAPGANNLRLVVNRAVNDAQAATTATRFGVTCRRFLELELQPPAVLPALVPGETPGSGSAFSRALRLLAADLAGACTTVVAGSLAPARRAAQAAPR